MQNLPRFLTDLIEELATMPGVSAIALGGSRASGSHDSGSDWDLGVYYQGQVDLTKLAARGEVHPPGSWGRLMNGGAWLMCEGHRVDVLLRDRAAVEHWTVRAKEGEFEVDSLLGYLAGAPTYLLSAELAAARVLYGKLPAAPFPALLAAHAPSRWRFRRTFSLNYARAHAKRGNVAGAVGQVAKALMEEAHAVLCSRSQWACNEKRLVSAAGLDDVHSCFQRIPLDAAELAPWIDRIATELGANLEQPAPWQI